MLPTTHPTQTGSAQDLGHSCPFPLFPQRGRHILTRGSISHACHSYSHASLIVGDPFCTWNSLISPQFYHNLHLFTEHLLYSGRFIHMPFILISMQISSDYDSHCTDGEFSQASKKLKGLAKITQLLRDREGNQVQIPDAYVLPTTPPSLAVASVMALGVWLPLILKVEGTVFLSRSRDQSCLELLGQVTATSVVPSKAQLSSLEIAL